MNQLNKLFQAELNRPPPKLGSVQPCIVCGQPMQLVEGYDMELLLQTGQLVKSGETWIHAGPKESAECRRLREKSFRWSYP